MTQLIHISYAGFPIIQLALIAMGILFSICLVSSVSADPPQKRWQIGAPIVNYWAGPPMTDATAKQMVEGNWNLVWCREGELDVAHRHGLRAMLHEPLLRPENLDQPEKRAEIDALIERVRNHPALYAYFLRDEPSVAMFPELGGDFAAGHGLAEPLVTGWSSTAKIIVVHGRQIVVDQRIGVHILQGASARQRIALRAG